MSNHRLTRENTALQTEIVNNYVLPNLSKGSINDSAIYIGGNHSPHRDYIITIHGVEETSNYYVEAKCDETSFANFALELFSNVPNSDVPFFCHTREQRLDDFLRCSWVLAKDCPEFFERVCYMERPSGNVPYARGLLTAQNLGNNHLSLLVKKETGKAYLCNTARLQEQAYCNRDELSYCPGRNEGKGYVNLCAKIELHSKWFKQSLVCPPFDVSDEVSQLLVSPSVAELMRPLEASSPKRAKSE